MLEDCPIKTDINIALSSLRLAAIVFASDAIKERATNWVWVGLRMHSECWD
jgi:hypothetical protein